MIWILLIGIILVCIIGNLIENLGGIAEILLIGVTGKIIATISIISLATLIIYKITEFAILKNIPRYGVVVIIVIITCRAISYFWRR